MDLLLPGPGLAEWLLAALGGKKVALWTGPDAGRGRGGRAARATTTALRQRLGWTELAGASGLDGLVVVVALGGAEPPEDALRAVQDGGALVELAHPPVVPLWRPSRWAARAELVRRASQARAGEWLGRGCFAVEQWAPIDTPRLLVTCGRVRAIPGP
ncbi:hypothetical protein [Nannocystis bainbridge]|uniref:Uncharacterized protein n=1 Tax=Nannocystis bainbridge TaxID=2995303 RepID=A0ABT5DXY2_9BACT|nr:hypothetical protein [Nannocystis bainbridge]MDC0718431.1 hypothetical protein [Nannocystis bainbridge]